MGNSCFHSQNSGGTQEISDDLPQEEEERAPSLYEMAKEK